MDPSNRAVNAAAIAIARYLEDHPDASDTVEGVSEWWLGRRDANSVVTVSAALDLLISKGVLQKTGYPGGRTLYSLAQKTSK